MTFGFLKTVCFFSVGSLLATYGWYIVFSCILLYVVFQKLSTRLRALRQRQLDRAAAAVGQCLEVSLLGRARSSRF